MNTKKAHELAMAMLDPAGRVGFSFYQEFLRDELDLLQTTMLADMSHLSQEQQETQVASMWRGVMTGVTAQMVSAVSNPVAGRMLQTLTDATESAAQLCPCPRCTAARTTPPKREAPKGAAS